MPLESFFGFFIFEEFFRFRFLNGEREGRFRWFLLLIRCHLTWHRRYNRMRSERKAGKETGERGGVDTAGVEGVSVFVTLFFFFFFPLLPLRESTHRKRGAPGPRRRLPRRARTSLLADESGGSERKREAETREKKMVESRRFFLFESEFFLKFHSLSTKRKKKRSTPLDPPPPPLLQKAFSALNRIKMKPLLRPLPLPLSKACFLPLKETSLKKNE